MKKKKGFTLVELLAVIVILAVILVIAVPRITDVIKKARLSSLESTSKLIVNQAEKKYTENQVLGNTNKINCNDVANLNDTDYGACKITIDANGNASVILNGKKNGKFDNLTCSGTKDNIICSEGQTSIAKKCTTTETLTQGLEFVDGQYTYTYNGTTGFRVTLTDKTSTDPVTTELCGTINDKPIVVMASMFYGSQATSIDLSSFDTSKVNDMSYMFYGSQATNLDLSSFDTSKVTDMSSMFKESQATKLDLSSFDTSKVTNMGSMFWKSQATSIDLSSFNTSKVTNMREMFYGSKATNLDLSSFNTSKVKDMDSIFNQSQATSIDLSSFDTSQVTNMSWMFANSKATKLDLSSFDTSQVTNMGSMFWGSQATTGYAKTCDDASRLNASSNRPDELTFIVKDTTC